MRQSNSGQGRGTGGSGQLDIEQLETEQRSRQIEEALENVPRQIDYFAGPNGMLLPAEYQSWIGDNRRESLLSRAANLQLRNAIHQLYRKNSFIGDGGTADVIRFEKATRITLGRSGRTHEQKGRDMLRYLERIIHEEDLSLDDQRLANRLISDLRDALGGLR